MKTKGRYIFLIFPSIIEGFLISLGRLLACERPFLSFGPVDLIVLLAGTAGAFLMNASVLYYVQRSGAQSADKYLSPEGEAADGCGRFSGVRFFIRAAVIFACWFPVFLAYYPTIWSYDIWAQLPYTSGSYFDGTHPVIHTLLIELFMHIGKFLGSYEIGMVMLSVLQMVTLSLIFSYCIEKASLRGAGTFARILCALFYALIPSCRSA